MRRYQVISFFVFIGFFFHGCASQYIPPAHLPSFSEVSSYSSDSMILINRPYSEYLSEDDLPKSSLADALEQSLVYLNKIPGDQIFEYGNLEYTAAEVIASYQIFQNLLSRNLDTASFIQELENQFYLFESPSNFEDQVLFTGYYEPMYPGSLTYSPEYPVPVYAIPNDLRVLELDQFRESLKDRTIVYRLVGEHIVPYYSRREIMESRVLADQGLEIAWMKSPVDLLFLQIQGSGILRLPSGAKMKLGYGGANGHGYSSIGKLLVDEGKMVLEEVSMQSLRDYLYDHEDDMMRIIYHNRSYTFFIKGDYVDHPRGSLNVPLTPLRSVASDLLLFPKAAIAYIDTSLPVFDQQTWQYTGEKEAARFAVIQDTGGAIKGTDRVDLFWGNGILAEKSAGKMRSMGKVYILIAKKEALSDTTNLSQASM